MKHQKKNDLQLFATKLSKKISYPHIAKEYQSFLKKKNTKSVKQSNIITQQ